MAMVWHHEASRIRRWCRRRRGEKNKVLIPSSRGSASWVSVLKSPRRSKFLWVAWKVCAIPQESSRQRLGALSPKA